MMRRPVEARGSGAIRRRVVRGTSGSAIWGNMKQLRSAAYFIESTMGPGNMGYRVQRQIFEVEDKEVWKPGGGDSRRLPGLDEVVIVGAHYDTVPGSPGGRLTMPQEFAALMSARTGVSSGRSPSERCASSLSSMRKRPVFSDGRTWGSVRLCAPLPGKGRRTSFAMVGSRIAGVLLRCRGLTEPPGWSRGQPNRCRQFHCGGRERRQPAFGRAGCGLAPREGGQFPVEEAVFFSRRGRGRAVRQTGALLAGGHAGRDGPPTQHLFRNPPLSQGDGHDRPDRFLIDSRR